MDSNFLERDTKNAAMLRVRHQISEEFEASIWLYPLSRWHRSTIVQLNVLLAAHDAKIVVSHKLFLVSFPKVEE